MATKKPAKFIQLVACDGTLHALDADGVVWWCREEPNYGWVETTGQRYTLEDQRIEQERITEENRRKDEKAQEVLKKYHEDRKVRHGY